MFTINQDNSIFLTRGDIAVIKFSADKRDGSPYIFKDGDIVRFKVFEKKQCDNVFIKKDVTISDDTATVDITLERIDTKIGEIINKPVDYWYEIELNPDTTPQTLIGYDDDGPKIFRLFPEGGEYD